MDEPDWWAKCSDGEIDPRPRTMRMVHERWDLILNNGGAFIIFADPRHRQKLVIARQYPGYDGFSIEKEIYFDNWSLLSALSSVEVNSDYGEELTISHPDWAVSRLLEDHLGGARFTCNLNPQYRYRKAMGCVGEE